MRNILIQIRKSLLLSTLLFSALVNILMFPAHSNEQAIITFADTVLRNGEIYTTQEKSPWATSVAIQNDRIIFVGNDQDVEQYIGPNTQLYELGDKLVLPGLFDAHTHPGMVAISENTIELQPSENLDELYNSIRTMVKENPNQEILIGGYWENSLFDAKGPHKRDLDKIESERPIILYDAWAHSIWANSKALEMAGVTRETPDIVPGFSFYQRDENGDPTGWITESASSVFINNFQSVTPKVEQSLLEFLTYLRNAGVTTVLDGGNFGLDNEIYAAVSRIDKASKLPLRYHGAYTLFLPEELTTAVSSLENLAARYNSEKVKIDTLKVFLDGIIETRTADMVDDYLDTPGNSGSSLLNREQIHGLILELNAKGYNLHVHSVGNQAVKTVLGAVEDAHRTLSAQPNITITMCHIEVVDDEDFKRFKELGIIASFTPHWLGITGEDAVPAIGDKAFSLMRAQPLISDGAVFTFSSDITDYIEWKSDRASPFVGMQIGHNRQVIEGGPTAPIGRPQSERLQRIDLVDGYTKNAAMQFDRSGELGSILVGAKADLIILNQNLFKVDRYDIHKTKPIAVFQDGKMTYGTLKQY